MRRLLIVIVGNFFISFLYGQLMFTAQNQLLIEEAIKDGFFVIRRCYQLQDTAEKTPTYFGWNNLPYFGETYTIGIKIPEGYYFTDKAFRPWMYDGKFADYAGSSRYVPVLSAGSYRLPEDTVYQVFPDSGIVIKEMSTHRVYVAQDTALFGQKGFSVDYTDGVKKGWLVWVVSDKPLEEQPNQSLSYLIYRTELTFEPERDWYEIRDPATSQHIVGGFYLLPQVTAIGHIVFHLIGTVHPEKGKWQVVRVSHSTHINATQPHATGGSLTPINSRRNSRNQ